MFSICKPAEAFKSSVVFAQSTNLQWKMTGQNDILNIYSFSLLAYVSKNLLRKSMKCVKRGVNVYITQHPGGFRF